MGRTFTIALLIALAIVSVWWQLAERRARMAERQLAIARRAAVDADSTRRIFADSLASWRRREH